MLAVLTGPSGHLDGRIRGLRPALAGGSTSPIPVTVSIGAAVLAADSPLTEMGQPALERLIRTADSMMYRAKTAGGDRSLSTTL
ncbi:hypothetical protein QMK17_25875 [Rhodococcus sp. G-MC3]|uniref:hypothetical protein n=1 Tax=Rhodococcus sp. G-MC3 TaxID=3046209 RepID=UPI0024B9481A|nr:hypothetical protein [Rhodococcus sp. G-MC3]MDJ0396722.1 hypothetical protein [Rhodococcus sp. G-MC3]